MYICVHIFRMCIEKMSSGKMRGKVQRRLETTHQADSSVKCFIKDGGCKVCWHMPAIPVLVREDHKLEASLDH